MPQSVPSKDGYTLRGMLPPELRGEPDAVKQQFYAFVVREGLKVKDEELARGIGANGKDLPRIKPQTRKYRRSMMTPTGKGDPSAPPLTPGRALSRTRSLLMGRAFPDRAEFWWAYDPFTYDSWARILRVQKRKYGRDVFGLSSNALARVTARSWRAYARWRAGKRDAVRVPPPIVQPAAAKAPQRLPMVGKIPGPYAEHGMGATPITTPGQTTGGATWRQWLQFLRKPAPAVKASPRRGPYNVLLRMIFGS